MSLFQQQDTQAPRRGFLGFDTSDPLQLAMLLAPLAELLRHGAGSAVYGTAVQGSLARQQAIERRKAEEQARADRQAEIQREWDWREKQASAAEAQRRQGTIVDAIRAELTHPGAGRAILGAAGIQVPEIAAPPSMLPAPGQGAGPSAGGATPTTDIFSALPRPQAAPLSPTETRLREQVQETKVQAAFTASRDQLVKKIQERVDSGDTVGAQRAAQALDALANRAPGIGTSGDAELQKAVRLKREREATAARTAAQTARAQRQPQGRGARTEVPGTVPGNLRLAAGQYRRLDVAERTLRNKLVPGPEDATVLADLQARKRAILQQNPGLERYIGTPQTPTQAPGTQGAPQPQTTEQRPAGGRPEPAGGTPALHAKVAAAARLGKTWDQVAAALKADGLNPDLFRATYDQAKTGR